MSQVTDEWAQLNRLAREECAEALRRLLARPNRDPLMTICAAFLHKAGETLSAVNVLYAHNLQESAQGLIRILFELRINFDCFLRMSRADTRGACLRVLDAMMLEKIKQARASDFAGAPAGTRDRLGGQEREISSRYSAEEATQIRRNGFTGVPVEQRAAMTGHEVAYTIVYRNFSRNIHSTDYMESYYKAGLVDGLEIDESYIESRDTVAHSTAHFSAVGIMELANHVFQLGMGPQIESLGARKAAIRALNDRADAI